MLMSKKSSSMKPILFGSLSVLVAATIAAGTTWYLMRDGSACINGDCDHHTVRGEYDAFLAKEKVEMGKIDDSYEKLTLAASWIVDNDANKKHAATALDAILMREYLLNQMIAGLKESATEDVLAKFTEEQAKLNKDEEKPETTTTADESALTGAELVAELEGKHGKAVSEVEYAKALLAMLGEKLANSAKNVEGEIAEATKKMVTLEADAEALKVKLEDARAKLPVVAEPKKDGEVGETENGPNDEPVTEAVQVNVEDVQTTPLTTEGGESSVPSSSA